MERIRNPTVIAMAAAVLALGAQTAAAMICISETVTLRRVQGIVVYEPEDGPADALPGAAVPALRRQV